MRFACVFERGLFTQESALALFDAPCTDDLHKILHGHEGDRFRPPLGYSKTYAISHSAKELR
jgi:hypothetical protein